MVVVVVDVCCRSFFVGDRLRLQERNMCNVSLLLSWMIAIGNKWWWEADFLWRNLQVLETNFGRHRI